MARPALTSEDEAVLRESLRRCSPATQEAAVSYRRDGDPALVPLVVTGIIERFLDPEARVRLREGGAGTRLVEDLGLDSLTVMELVMLVEEVLRVSVQNDELRNLRTVGDLSVFVDCKARGVPPPAPPRFLPVEQIAALMPIEPPFLFLREASVAATQATSRYRLAGDEFFLRGHFKDDPVMPASIMLEMLGQLAVLHLLAGFTPDDERHVQASSILFTALESVRCLRRCRPGDELRLTVKLRRAHEPLAIYEGFIEVGGERAATTGEMQLAFALAAEAAPPAPEPAADTPAPAPSSAADAA